jgi:uncharacterized protein YcfJ
MNRSALIGVVAGIGVAVAGGIGAYTFLGDGDGVDAELDAAEECWDETVTVTAEPFDQNRIAGTVGGALVGGAVGKDIGDRDLTTAVGAAAGAFIGREVEEEIQENRAEQRSTTTVVRRCP